MSPRVIHGDCLDVMRQLAAEGVLVDSIVTDPPYGLGFMGKAWDKFEAADMPMRRNAAMDAVNVGQSRQGGRQRACADYQLRQARDMRAYQAWCEEWAEAAFALMKPGAHLVAFGGSRTFHRVACAVEDAGLEIRDTIMWVYGSGFPKSLNVGNGFGTALKPAHEPIILARKPLDGTVAANVLAHGTGALNIDGCRVETSEPNPSIARRNGAINHLSGRPARETEAEGRMASRQSPESYRAARPGETLGRWPANLCHDGSDEVLEAFAAFGEKASGSGNKNGSNRTHSVLSGGPLGAGTGTGIGGDTGTAARFFYSSKASTGDRAGSKHPTVKPVALMRWLCRLVTPPGGLILDPFAGSGTTLQAAAEEGFRAIGIEREAEYVADIERRMVRVAPHQADIFAGAAA